VAEKTKETPFNYLWHIHLPISNIKTLHGGLSEANYFSIISEYDKYNNISSM
jgi:hypothetical protein